MAGVGLGLVAGFLACTGDTVVPSSDAGPDVVSDVTTGDATADGTADTGTDAPLDVAKPPVGTGKFINPSYLPLQLADGGTTTASYGIVAADVTGDKHLDLIVSGGSAGVVFVFPGKGDGTFGTPASFAAGTNPYGIAAADFNGDQKLDLAVANSTTGTVNVLLNTGSGAFGAPTVLTTAGSAMRYVVAADVDGDGKQDLVATESSAGLDVFIGAGNGTFAAAKPFAVPAPWNVAVADLNGDAKPDLLVGTNSANVYVLLNVGGGTLFGAASAFVTNHDAGSGAGAYAAIVGDYNGDNAREVAVAKCQNGANSLNMLPTVADGSLGPASDYLGVPEAGCLYDLTSAKLDPDGIPDLVMGGNKLFVRSSTLLDAGYGAIDEYMPDAAFGSFQFKTITTGDFNEDGVQDLAAIVTTKPWAYVLIGEKKQ